MDQPNPTFAKIPILDTGKFEQWKFRIQQYLQNEHYALWEVIEFGDSYKAPQEELGKGPSSESSTKKNGRTVVITTEDMQKRRNDVKARTTLLLALPGEHQMRFSKYETAKELWEAILKTFETLAQTFNKLQAIVSHLEFIDVEIKQDDLNQKFLTSLATEWLMYTIVWRNRDDLDTMSLDDVYNHLKVYEPEVQKKSDSNSQNMAFISSSNTSSGKGKVYNASVSTASTQVSTASTNVIAASLSHDTVCAYIASQLNGSQIKYEDITQIDEDDIEEMDIKWNMALLSMRADRWNASIATRWAILLEVRTESYMANEEENHALVPDDKAPTEFALMAKSSSSSENEVYDDSYCSKSCRKNTENLNTKISKLNEELSDSENNLYHYKLGLPKFADDTVTDYSRPSPNIDSSKSNTSDLQNSNSSVSEHGKSSTSIMSKPMIKFVKPADFPGVIKTNKTKTARKSPIKYAEMYRNTSKSPNDSGCSRHMTGNISYLSEYEPYDGGYVSFGQRESLGKGWTCNLIMAKLAFCDYHTMIAILDKIEHNINFHQIVDFIKASHIRYALTINPTIYVSHIRQFWSTARIKTTNEETKILATVDALRVNSLSFSGRTVPLFASMLVTQGEGSAIPIEPHHTPSSQEQHSSHHDTSSPSHPNITTEPILPTPIETPTETLTLRQYSRRATRIAQSKALSPVADELAYLLRDDSQGEAFPTVSSLDVGQDRELMDLYIGLQRQQTQMAAKIKDQDLEISSLKARVKILEDKDRGREEPAQEDAPIKGESMEIREEVSVERSTEVGSNDTEEMVNVLSAMEAANILTSRVAAVSVSPVAAATAVGVPTVSRLVPTVSAIFTTASVVTPYSRRLREIFPKDKGKEKVVESNVPKKKKLQEHIDAPVAREIEEEFARDNQRLSEQLARDSKIARLYAEEELKMMIKGLDISNEMIAKHLYEYEQAGVDLSIGEEIKLINELVKYQDHHAKILKYQAQQRKPLLKKEQREFYMSVLRSHARWKTRHFRGMTLEEIKEKFIPVWKQIEDFVPISSKEEGERMKRKWLKLDQRSAKKMKTSEDVSEEDLKRMMQLREYWKIIRLGGHTAVYQFFVDMLKQFDREDLYQLWILVKETLTIKQATKDKEMELWVELKRLFEPDFEDQLWTHNQNFMHDLLE
uniref:Uncharacterized protein n=1 Tax=Tanacetum cinerariifolium TaxID=118510 RepID=A0A6L2LXM9_TANCI|nr:hypothetical protein [Tanacetum cinerariifolium]